MDMQTDNFIRVLAEVENSFTVSHIAAFPVWCCSPEQDVEKLLEEIAPGGTKDYSHVPIRKARGHIHSVVYRSDLPGKKGTAAAFARKIDAGDKISADAPLLRAIGQLKNTGFRLVTSVESGQEDGVSGIINHADLQKLPVRLLLFAHFSQLEATLRALVTGSDWSSHKNCGKGCKQERKFAEKGRKRQKGDNLPLEQYLNIQGLVTVAHCLKRFASHETDIISRAESLRLARNRIAHGLDLGNDDAQDPMETVKAVEEAFAVVEWAFNAIVPAP